MGPSEEGGGGEVVSSIMSKEVFLGAYTAHTRRHYASLFLLMSNCSKYAVVGSILL
jgi:hypothetical protein